MKRKIRRRSNLTRALDSLPKTKSKKKKVRSIRRRSPKKTRVEFLSSGITTLNLALSGKAKGGWGRGRIVNIVGDGSTGKTLLALECAFWCWKNITKQKSKLFPKTKDLLILYMNAEGVMDFPLESMYGEDFVNAISWKSVSTVEQAGRYYARMLREHSDGKTFILAIIDSWDAIKSVDAKERFEESVDKDKKEAASFDGEKQKYASKYFANITDIFEENKANSTFIIISQIRDNIGVTFGRKSRRAGGKALDFYTHQVVWLKQIKKMQMKRLGEKRPYGVKVEVEVSRSKVAKPYRRSRFRILFDYGADDTNSMLDYLYGPERNTGLKWNDNTYDRKQLVQYIEQQGLENKLAKQVERKWKRVEEKITEDTVGFRKKRY